MTNARRAGVLGSPIAHSLSPVLHRAAYAALGLDWSYDAYDVDEDGLADFLDRLDESWVGLSLTMPLKTRVIDFLDEVTDLASMVAAVNTVVVREGRLWGDNTDVPGMVAAIDDRVAGTAGEGRSIHEVAIIGAGATARSAIAAVARRHRGESPRVRVYARDPQRARDLEPVAAGFAVAVDIAPWSQLGAAWQADLVVSTLPGSVGLAPDPPAAPGVLMDVAYSPWPTPLSRAWRQAGGIVATGADLLLWQAVHQVRLMTGVPAPVDAMRAALLAALEV